MYITNSILFFFFFQEWKSEGLRGLGGVEVEVGCLDMLFSKILPETKIQIVFIPTYTRFFFSFPKTEVKRNVQKFHVLTFTFPKDGCCFFTPQLFGCSPPAFSPPQKSRSPSHRSSSFLAWISSCRPSMPGLQP